MPLFRSSGHGYEGLIFFFSFLGGLLGTGIHVFFHNIFAYVSSTIRVKFEVQISILHML